MLLVISIFTLFNEPILRSALVPGWGEWTLQKKSKGEIFFVIEGGLWLLYGGLNYYSGEMNDNAHTYAVEMAGANAANKDERYLKALEKYMTSEAYNEAVERDASYYYPDDLRKQQEYIQSNGYFGEDTWEWPSENEFILYWEKRKAGREALRMASFCIGLTLFNRVASIIDVAFFTPRLSGFGIKSGVNQIGIVYRFF
ncbi:MAG: hypothetical protein ABIK18_06405 [candidate division WOR-3 bacterium]